MTYTTIYSSKGTGFKGAQASTTTPRTKTLYIFGESTSHDLSKANEEIKSMGLSRRVVKSGQGKMNFRSEKPQKEMIKDIRKPPTPSESVPAPSVSKNKLLLQGKPPKIVKEENK